MLKILDRRKAYNSIDRKDNYIFYRKRSRELNKKYRLLVLGLLGCKCKICGFSDYRALQIDHVDGGGCKEKRVGNKNKYYYNELLKGSKKYQLLCANCNWIKRFENNETAILL